MGLARRNDVEAQVGIGGVSTEKIDHVQHDVAGNMEEEPMVQEGGTKEPETLEKNVQGYLRDAKLATKRTASVQEVGGKGLTKKKRSGQGVWRKMLLNLIWRDCGTALPIQMSLINWNCRRLGNPWTIHDLSQMVKEKKPSFLFLIETISSKKLIEGLRVQLGFEGLFVVEPVGRSGGLALSWKTVDEL